MDPETDQTVLTADEQAFFAQGDGAEGVDGAATDTSTETAQQPEAGTQGQPDDTAAAAAANKQRMVPHAALHEAREESKALKAQLQAEAANRATLEQRTNIILDRFMQMQGGQQQLDPGAQKAEIPDIAADPLGHIVGLLKAQGHTVESLQQAEAQRQQMTQRTAVTQQIQAHASALETQFVSQQPDYWDASSFLRDSRDREYALMGYGDPVQRQQMIANEAMQIAARAIQSGQNPAAAVYQLAQARGYQKRGAAGAGQGAGANQQAGAAAIARVAGGQQAGAGVGSVPGAAPRGMTAERLAQMSDAEFAKALEDPKNLALLGAN